MLASSIGLNFTHPIRDFPFVLCFFCDYCILEFEIPPWRELSSDLKGPYMLFVAVVVYYFESLRFIGMKLGHFQNNLNIEFYWKQWLWCFGPFFFCEELTSIGLSTCMLTTQVDQAPKELQLSNLASSRRGQASCHSFHRDPTVLRSCHKPQPPLHCSTDGSAWVSWLQIYHSPAPPGSAH